MTGGCRRRWTKRSTIGLAALASCVVTAGALADTPGFDRPGIAFSTDTLPRGSFAFEQGLPDFTASSDAGTKTRLFTADTHLRLGVSRAVEVQLDTALLNDQRTKAAGRIDHDSGVGDASLGVKVALPTASDAFAIAVLGTLALAVGQRPFSAEKPQYDLAAAASLKLQQHRSIGVYVDLDRYAGATTVTLSPNFNLQLSEQLSAYIEAGAALVGHGADTCVAGGGFAWMVLPTVQLDVSSDFGLNSASPEVQAGFGVSIFFE